MLHVEQPKQQKCFCFVSNEDIFISVAGSKTTTLLCLLYPHERRNASSNFIKSPTCSSIQLIYGNL